MKVLIIASYSKSIFNFRGELLKEIMNRGHKVFVATPLNDSDEIIIKKFNKMGIRFSQIRINKSEVNILSDIKTLIDIYKVINFFKPDLICTYTIKPNIFTGLILNIKNIFNRKKILFYPMVTGLGSVFLNQENSIKNKLLKGFVKKLFKVAFLSSKKIIFQNPDDIEFFKKEKIVLDFSKAKRVWGSGVNLKSFKAKPINKDEIFLMLSRLLKDKGIREYFEAARIVKFKYPKAKFLLAGSFDNNPSGIKKEEFKKLMEFGSVKYLGELKCVKEVLSKCTYYVLPSYREGTPRSSLEALAVGRPILSTDVPGCRETVIDGFNGYLVKSQDAFSLSNGMEKLLKASYNEIKTMSKNSLLLAKEKYDVKKINKDLIKYLEL